MAANTSTHQFEPLRSPSNWSSEEKKLVQQLSDLFDDIYSWRNRLRLQDFGKAFRNQVTGIEGGISDLEQTAQGISAEVSSSQVYRASSEAVLLAVLETKGVTLAPDLLWYDTTARLIKRCLTIAPITWEVLETNSVHTAGLDIGPGTFYGYSTLSFNLVGPNFGISTDDPSGILLWGGGDDPATAPLGLYRDGTMRNGANIYTMNFATEAGPSNPMSIPVFFPSDLYAIDKVLLYVVMKPFRATATGAASGGGTSVTSSDGGGAEKTSRSGGAATVTSGQDAAGANTKASGEFDTGAPSVASTGSGGTGATGAAGGHDHNSGSYAVSGTDVTGTSSFVASHTHTGPSHTHSMQSHTHIVGAHVHGLNQHTHSVSIGSHTHIVDIDAHSHTVTLEAHTHTIVYGIYEIASSGTFSVTIDGTVRRTGRSNETALDISDWFSKTSGKITRDTEHTILITPSALNRLEVQIMVKGAIVTNTIGTL